MFNSIDYLNRDPKPWRCYGHCMSRFTKDHTGSHTSPHQTRYEPRQKFQPRWERRTNRHLVDFREAVRDDFLYVVTANMPAFIEHFLLGVPDSTEEGRHAHAVLNRYRDALMHRLTPAGTAQVTDEDVERLEAKATRYGADRFEQALNLLAATVRLSFPDATGIAYCWGAVDYDYQEAGDPWIEYVVTLSDGYVGVPKSWGSVTAYLIRDIDEQRDRSCDSHSWCGRGRFAEFPAFEPTEAG